MLSKNTSSHIRTMRNIKCYRSGHTFTKEAVSQMLMLSKAIKQSPNAIFIADIKGKIEYVNQKGAQLMGYTSEEIIGKNPRIFKSGETTPEEYKQLWTTIKSGGEWRG